MVEFSLVLPLLLVLLLGIADFGRVFAAGITIEAAARNGAESAAQEYVQTVRYPPQLMTTQDYEHLHEVALWALCKEASVLPNYVPVAGAPDAPPAPDGVVDKPCTSPAAAVCVHDPITSPPVAYGPDPYCDGSEASGAPAQCSSLSAAWNPANTQAGSDTLGYVETRSCYRFTTLFNLGNLQLPFGASLTLGDVYLQRTRTFTISCYYGSSCR